MGWRPPVQRTRSGEFRFRVQAEELEILYQLITEVDALDGSNNSLTSRLRPPGSTQEAVAREFADLVGESQGQERNERRDRVCALLRELGAASDPDDPLTANPRGGRHLNADETAEVASVLNEVRLVLGTALGVTDDSDDTDALDSTTGLADPNRAAYHWLGWLLEHTIEALSGS